MMKTVLGIILLAILAFVAYAAYTWQNDEEMDIQKIEQIVKPKINDLKELIGTLTKRGSNTQKKATDTNDLDDAETTEQDSARYPLPAKQDFSMFEDQQQLEEFEKPLPELNESDAPIKAVVDRLLSNEYFGNLLRIEAVIHRFVVTVDNLSKEKLSPKFRLVKPVPGKFLTEVHTSSINSAAERYIIDKRNYKRYAGFMKNVEGIETDKLVAVYIYYYPLIQEAYDSLGYSGRYFNDRFVEVIDHLLATPSVRDPVLLERSTVTYKFANADLEARSAGQKIMIRLGRKNGSKVRKKLTRLRVALTKFKP